MIEHQIRQWEKNTRLPYVTTETTIARLKMRQTVSFIFICN